MELRVLRYFVEVAARGNFSAAAEVLNLTQPTLSKQIMELEDELGVKLFSRGKRRTTLTEPGERLLKSARELLELEDRAKRNIGGDTGEIRGEVSIAGGESTTMRLMAKAIRIVRAKHPAVKFQLYSGNAEAVSERLDKGLADFGAFVQPANLDKYDYVNLPEKDVWGVLLRKDDPLASRSSILPSDLAKMPLICSAQNMVDNELSGWMGNRQAPLNIIGTYTLLYNAAIMVQEGVGAALCLDAIADTSASSLLCFRPLEPALLVNMAIAWKKHCLFSPAAAAFHSELCRVIGEYKGGV